MSFMDILNKASIRSILALLFGVTVCLGFAKGMIGEDSLKELVLMIFVFFFAFQKTNNG